MNYNGCNVGIDVMESSFVVVLIIYKHRKYSSSLCLAARG